MAISNGGGPHSNTAAGAARALRGQATAPRRDAASRTVSGGGPATTVGVPTAENTLTDACAAHVGVLARASNGCRVVLMPWPEIGTGVPDGVVVSVDGDPYRMWRDEAPPLVSLGECRVLGADVAGRRSAYTPAHERRVRRRLETAGWSVRLATEMLNRQPVRSSLVFEAKISDWRRGIGQLMRYRWVAEEAALVVPANIAHRVKARALEHNEVGLAVVDGALSWRRVSPRRPVQPDAQLWVLELLRRHDAA